NDLYRQTWGVNLRMSSSYRCIDGQIRVASATPGTSQHGWGLAVDFLGPVARFGSAEHQWLRDHAPQFGWDHPTWARSGGSKPEPWHWEFLAATPMPRVALSAAEVEVRRSG
ncbi:MAG: M15 family metallopeptidase, partial [Cellulomonadaceae bacterium]|nr:M15 family metallopeptidase [Cellulomonadaceae bacterium]